MPGREFSLPELADDIREMRSDLHEIRQHLERTYVRQDVYEERQRTVDAQSINRDARISSVEAKLTWAVRAAVGSFLLPVLSAIVLYLLIGGPR